MIKKILPFLLILVLLLIIKNTAESILNSTREETTKEKLEKELQAAERENKYLEEQLFYVKTDEFVEEEAKENLGLLRPGELFVIAPTDRPRQEENFEIDTRSNWEKWLELFF